jgi:hypothetical protein
MLGYNRTKKELGISYLGSIAQSVKMRLSFEHGTMTYCLYLAPWNMSGYNVCPKGQHCNEFCLNGSGQNKCDELARGVEGSKINRSRIKKTKLFYENKGLFMEILTHEIESKREKAKRMGYGFSVRLNGTSDLSPLAFRDPKTGKNILELFNDVQFYDYTKVYNRTKLLETYDNYDLTFSYDGYNWDECEKFLQNNGKVAVVFYSEKGILPKKFRGYDVIDANDYDMRYLDPKRSIMGLHYHKTAHDYKSGHFVAPNTPFVINLDNETDVDWGF